MTTGVTEATAYLTTAQLRAARIGTERFSSKQMLVTLDALVTELDNMADEHEECDCDLSGELREFAEGYQ